MFEICVKDHKKTSKQKEKTKQKQNMQITVTQAAPTEKSIPFNN